MRRLLSRPVVAAFMLVAIVAIIGLVSAVTAADRIPDWLARKVEFEARHDEIVKQQQEKSAKEVQELEKARAEAPKDTKGNPLMQEVAIPKPQPMPPRENLGVVETATTVYLPSPVRDRYIITTQASAPYDVLIAGSEREDKTKGVIFQVKFSASGEIQVKDQSFPGKGPITLDSLRQGNQVVTFRWGLEGKGYFDLQNGTAHFEEYNPDP